MTDVPLETRIALLRAHGNFPQAYSATYQPGLSHFGDARGFIAYKRVGATALALADPVTPHHERDELIDRFVQEHRDAAFWQVSRPVAELLARRGFFINEFGPDLRLDLATYEFSGKAKQNLRSAVNRAEKFGHVIRECPIASLGTNEVKALSNLWRSTRTVHNREVSFINRPMVFEDEADVRTFFMFDGDGRLMALGGFDPIYEAGSVVGYIAQHNRSRPDADSFADYAIKHHAIKTFQQEGRKWLFLGLTPLAYIEDRDFAPNKNWLVHRGFIFAFRSRLFNKFAFPFRGHELHKRQFRGVREQTYYSFNKTPSLPRMIKVLRACGII